MLKLPVVLLWSAMIFPILHVLAIPPDDYRLQTVELPRGFTDRSGTQHAFQ
jgi:hypothetical protein